MKSFKELLEGTLNINDIVKSAANNTEDWLDSDYLTGDLKDDFNNDKEYYIKRYIEDFFDVFYDGDELAFAEKNIKKIIKLLVKKL